MAHRSKLAQAASETLIGCVLTCVENARTTIAIALCLSVVSVGLAVSFLSVNTDTARMIDKELPFRQRFEDLKRAFPHSDETLVVVVDSGDAEMSARAADALVQAFQARGDLYSDVYAPEIDPFFRSHGLLYLSEAELQGLSGQLQASVPMLVPLARDPTLRGLAQFMQIIGYSAQQGADIAAFTPFLNQIENVVEAHATGLSREMDWAGMVQPGAVAPESTRKFVIVKPVLDYASLEPAEQALKEARRVANTVSDAVEGVRIRFTGEVAMGAEELRSVADGALLASLISLILVSVVLVFGVRSWRLVVAALATLLIGLTWTAGVATLAVGYLNLISVAFAVMFLGLGIDFAIHFALRYEEETRRGMPLPIAFVNTANGIGGALAVCTGAAALGFLAFTPTSFVGMAQLGIISAAGMVIAFITSMTVLPAFLALMPLPSASAPPPAQATRPGKRLNWRRPAALATLACCVVAVFFLPQVRFDGDPINLKDPDTESVRTFLELFEDSTTAPYTAQVLTTEDADAVSLTEKLTALPEVSRVISIFSFIPDAQERKLPIVRGLRSAVSQIPIVEAEDIGAEGRAEALATMAATLDQLSALPNDAFSQAASSLSDSIATFSGIASENPERSAELERALFVTFGPTLSELGRTVSADQVSVATLPASIRDRYVSQDGQLRLEVFPSGNVSDADKMRAFSDAVLAVAPDATGSPIEITGAADVVVRAMLEATAIAGVLICLVLALTLRRLRDVVLVLVPIILAASLTLATTVWIGMPFNFANVIVLPLLIGLGVAGGVHLVVRSRLSPDQVSLFETNTPRAVLLSALTTIGSFASLATSGHRGTASMGVLLTVSILFTLVCTLIVLPQLIEWLSARRTRASEQMRP